MSSDLLLMVECPRLFPFSNREFTRGNNKVSKKQDSGTQVKKNVYGTEIESPTHANLNSR